MNEALALIALVLGAASLATTVRILHRLERERWPHGRDRICPDPGCRCWRSAAGKLTRNGRRSLL